MDKLIGKWKTCNGVTEIYRVVKNKFYFEIYTQHKGVTGWDIEVGIVIGQESRTDAIKRIKSYFGKKFDCVIQCYETNMKMSDFYCEHPILIQSM